MQYEIRTQGFDLTDGLRAHIQRRWQFALDWARHETGRALLRLSDINGPRGGNDKCCQIRIGLRRMRDVVVVDTAADLYVAIDRAIDRAARTLQRRLSRQREFGPMPAVHFGSTGERDVPTPRNRRIKAAMAQQGRPQ